MKNSVFAPFEQLFDRRHEKLSATEKSGIFRRYRPPQFYEKMR